jgi:(R,R)-butanediol dehydrogenase/meso-butanediol dehydrogenase/diacetyl reductase
MVAATMQALVWTGQGLEVQAVPRPVASAGEVVLDVAFAGICGTDLHIFSGEHWRAKPGLVPGHEFAGTIAPHQAAGDLAPGTPVFVNPLLADGTCRSCLAGRWQVCETLGLVGIDVAGGLAEQVAVPATALVPLPAGVSLASAALAEPVAVAIRAIRRSGLRVGDRVHVIGAGPIGLFVATTARASGASRVTVSEPSPLRAAAARDMGFAVVESADELGQGGADVVFDCTGSPAVSAGVLAWVLTSGTVVVTGLYPGITGVDLKDLMLREITMIGTRVYARDDVRAAVSAIASGLFTAEVFVSSFVGLDGVAAAADRLRAGQELKVLATLGGEPA